jgi:hypothetical protein
MSPKLPPRIPSLKRKTLTAGSNTLTQTLVLRKTVTVLGIWFAQFHLFRTPRKSKVSSTATGSPKADQSAKQASSLVTLLRATVVRERTSQEIVGVHF